MQYWQIGIGDGKVDMVDIFIKLNIALIGPGNKGDFFDNKDGYLNTSDGHIVQKFSEEVQVGDIFVLKHIVNPQTKLWKIYALGKVVGPYRYEPIFNCVDENKWDVQHCHRVIWKDVRDKDIIVDSGGAPIRFQRLGDDNKLKLKAQELLKEIIF